jgi:hypothetical protein
MMPEGSQSESLQGVATGSSHTDWGRCGIAFQTEPSAPLESDGEGDSQKCSCSLEPECAYSTTLVHREPLHLPSPGDRDLPQTNTIHSMTSEEDSLHTPRWLRFQAQSSLRQRTEFHSHTRRTSERWPFETGREVLSLPVPMPSNL